MNFIPSKEREKFYLPNFLMDNLIVFFMSGLIAFIIPLFTTRRARNSHVEKVLSMYNQHDNATTLRNVCMLIGAVIAILVCSFRLLKFHIYSLEVLDNQLTVISYNLLGQKSERKIDLEKSALKLVEFQATKERDPGIKLVFQSGATAFTTEGSKYWTMRRDRGTLNSLKEELNKRT